MSNKFITIDDIDVKGKKILVRVDMNVPIKDGKIDNNERIVRSIPTIKELSDKGAKVLILSHLGRPDGTGYQEKFSLKIIAEALSELLKKPIAFAKDCVGEEAKKVANTLNDGDIAMLENVRFHKEETKNDLSFTKELASLGEVFVSDAFSAAHRSHSSTEGLAHLLPYAAGRLMQEELEALENALGNPKKPVVAIVGGAKISTKLNVLNNLVKKVDYLIIGGAMGTTFLHAMGVNIGNSLCEHNMAENCLEIMHASKQNNCQIILPVDSKVGLKIDDPASAKILSNYNDIGNYEIYDAGPQSVTNFIEIIKLAKTIIWNGPVGAFEFKPYDEATITLAKEVGALCEAKKLTAIAGGGDTVSALSLAGVINKLTYVSTAGGAFLEWMEGKELPGVVCLLKK